MTAHLPPPPDDAEWQISAWTEGVNVCLLPYVLRGYVTDLTYRGRWAGRWMAIHLARRILRNRRRYLREQARKAHIESTPTRKAQP